MRRIIAAVALLTAVAGTIAAQAQYVVTGSVRLPAESYVGDPVELRYSIRTTASPVVPATVTQPRWGTVSGLRVQPSGTGFDLRLTVVPFEPGTLTLPPIDLGTLRVEGLSLVVESILAPGESGLRAAHGPQRLPGTSATLLLYAIGVSLIISTAIYLSGPGRRHLVALVAKHRARAPYRRLLARVQSLEREIKRYSMRDFYIELVRELQAFMSSRTERNCLAATSTELIDLLPELEERCGATAGIAGPLEEVLRAADSAKFARKTVRRKKRLHHLKLVHAVAVELESHRRGLHRTGRAAQTQVSHVGA